MNPSNDDELFEPSDSLMTESQVGGLPRFDLRRLARLRKLGPNPVVVYGITVGVILGVMMLLVIIGCAIINAIAH